mgnify:CR=1 FL=1
MVKKNTKNAKNIKNTKNKATNNTTNRRNNAKNNRTKKNNSIAKSKITLKPTGSLVKFQKEIAIRFLEMVLMVKQNPSLVDIFYHD